MSGADCPIKAMETFPLCSGLPPPPPRSARRGRGGAWAPGAVPEICTEGCRHARGCSPWRPAADMGTARALRTPPPGRAGGGARGQIPSQARDPLAPCGAGPKRRERGGLVGGGPSDKRSIKTGSSGGTGFGLASNFSFYFYR